MPDIAEMDSYEMLREDWGSTYLINRSPGAAQPLPAPTGTTTPPPSSPPPAPPGCAI